MIQCSAELAQERVTTGPDGLVLKHSFGDVTVAIELDPLALLCRLAASVPAPGWHTVRYAGVLASARKFRPRIVSAPPAVEVAQDAREASKPKRAGCRYRSSAELLRTLGIDAFACPSCQGRKRVLGLVRDPGEVRRFLRALGEPTAPPKRAPARGPPYWAIRALRIRSDADAA